MDCNNLCPKWDSCVNMSRDCVNLSHFKPEAQARIAELEAENEELRKRLCEHDVMFAISEEMRKAKEKNCPKCGARVTSSIQMPEGLLVDDCTNCTYHSGLYAKDMQ